jgi:TP901 family phage tail tape measure protein
MAKSNAIRAGRAFVELFADDTKLVRGLRAAERRLKAFGASISRMGRQMVGIGTAVLTPLVAASKAFAAMGDSIGKMSKRTGFSAEALSELSFAAQQSGTDIGAFENGVRRMQRPITDAGQGLKSASDALGMLGLSYQQLSRLSPEEQFKTIADQLSQIKNPTTRAAMAMQLFGRSGTALLPMLEQGAAGIEALQAEARALGLTMSSEDAKAAEDFTDALGRLWKVVKMTTFQVGAALAPALKQLSGWVTKVVVTFNDWLKNNRQVVVMVAKVAAAVVAGGIALIDRKSVV